MTPQDIADLLQREGSGGQEDDYDETLESESVVQRRTELLADVLKTCAELLRNSDVGQLEVVAEKLGDGSRDGTWHPNSLSVGFESLDCNRGIES